jgi:polyhydroxybutyrate depolymerase
MARPPKKVLFALLASLCLATPAVGIALTLIPWEGMRSFQEVLIHDGETRFVSHLRPVAPAADTPALFLLPYEDGNAPAMANLTEIGQLVRDHGVWVVIPLSLSGSWAHNPNGVNQPDDVGFLASVIGHAVTAYGLNPKRIYMAGYSAGGNMSMRFACERPELIAGAASIGATIRTALANACQPAVPVPVAFMHGTADDQVRYAPGPLDTNALLLRGNLGAVEAAALWAAANQCPGPPGRREFPDLVDDGTRVYSDRYENCAAGTSVELLTVQDGGHNWPGTLDFIPRIGLVTQDISGTQELWKFLRRFSRP